MSDEPERGMERLMVLIVDFYDLLAALLAKLPVPIALPEGPVYDSVEMTSAVRRVAEIIGDQPVSEDVKIGVWAASLHWLTAAEMFSLLRVGGWDGIRADQVRIILASGEAGLEGAADALLRDQE
ncbi:hypothetical protein [Streptomyces sp. DH37]|uniref:hypothetical protein n=1 Tax=Streptomyces sp. DH37 TaxID=3040122 RepID=UPI0024417183|nr:hypothetical protein [Streptomyces sp. DH37]MDG9703784.1 hypothetical protein [Streptomyces sp. DH37]